MERSPIYFILLSIKGQALQLLMGQLVLKKLINKTNV